MKFGISSCSFQIEENNKNSHLYSKNKNGCFHKKFWKEDYKLLKNLGIATYRFSIEWSEIEKKEGNIDDSVLRFYHEQIDWLKKHNIEPVLCLFHFSMPKWFHKEGGFVKVPEKFEFFARRMINEYGSKVKHFVIYNEPNVFCVCSYLIGRWEPNQINYYAYNKCIGNMLQTYNSIVDKYSSFKFGIIVNIIPGHTDTFLNSFFDDIWNSIFLTKLSKKTNFIGINYYFSKDKSWSDVFFSGRKDFFRDHESISNFGWPIEPKKISKAVDYVRKYYPTTEIWITENGLSTNDPEHQHTFIQDHVDELVQQNKVKRYYYWTLLDCFEWDYKNAHFGLVAVDKKTGKRTPKSSYYFYKKLIQELQT